MTRDEAKKPIETAVIPMSESEVGFSLELAQKLRSKGEVVDVVLTDRKLGDKLKYAAKVAKQAIVIGEAEVKSGEYAVKEFK